MQIPTPLRAAAAALLAGVVIAASATTATALPASDPAVTTGVHRACGDAPEGEYACLAEVVVPSRTTQRLQAQATTIPGLKPADIASAYRFKGGHRGLVAVVGAYDNPKLEADLAAYRKHFHLPACTTGNGCFTKVNQDGSKTDLPEQDAGWGLEAALDVQAVSAACPMCRILVVEGDEPTPEALGTGVNTAVRMGAKAVSNSYGGLEVTGVEADGPRYFTHPGVPILAASGDDGFPSAISPATYSSVIAVGGTTLKRSHGRWVETAWASGGSGCSAYIAKPAWQKDGNCPMRTIADVAALGDPDPGFAVYDTFGTDDFTDSGWLQVGGTSLSTPLVAGMIVRSGKAARYDGAKRLYDRRAAFRDLTAGSNGTCGGDYLCTAKKGYDAPTGVGAPRTLGSF